MFSDSALPPDSTALVGVSSLGTEVVSPASEVRDSAFACVIKSML